MRLEDNIPLSRRRDGQPHSCYPNSDDPSYQIIKIENERWRAPRTRRPPSKVDDDDDDDDDALTGGGSRHVGS